MSYTFGIYKEVLLDISNRHDKFYLANNLSKLYKWCNNNGGCVDSCRISEVQFDGGWTEDYEGKITCCGRKDKLVTNPATGNSYWIGFNYGH